MADIEAQNPATYLFADLLRIARGDRKLVAQWMAEISAPTPAFGALSGKLHSRVL